LFEVEILAVRFFAIHTLSMLSLSLDKIQAFINRIIHFFSATFNVGKLVLVMDIADKFEDTKLVIRRRKSKKD